MFNSVARYVGGLKERTVEEQFEREPTEVLRKAVERMLPKNRLRDVSSSAVVIYPEIVDVFRTSMLSSCFCTACKEARGAFVCFARIWNLVSWSLYVRSAAARPS